MQARAAVASGGGARSRSWLRWSAPVALAASVVLVVTVVIESGVQDDTSFATKAVDEVRQADKRQVEEHKLLEKSAQSLQQEPPEQFAPEPAAIVTQAAPAAAPASPPPAATRQGRGGALENVASEEVRVDAQAVRDQSQDRRPSVRVVGGRFARCAVRSRAAGTVSGGIDRDRLGPQGSRPRGGEAEADSADDSVNAERRHRQPRAARRPGAHRRSAQHDLRVGTQQRDAAGRRRPTPSSPIPTQWLEEIRDLRRAGKVADADREWQRVPQVVSRLPRRRRRHRAQEALKRAVWFNPRP